MSSNENIILIAGIGIVFLGFIYLSSKKDDNKNITTLSNGETFKWISTPAGEDFLKKRIPPNTLSNPEKTYQMLKDGYKLVTTPDGKQRWER